MSYLYLFQIGPVQAFIAQARRTQDLYVGSRILSTLAAAGVQQASKTGSFEAIFPFVEKGSKLPAGVPHRFAFISTDAPDQVAPNIVGAIIGEWQSRFVQRVGEWLARQIGGGNWESVFIRQTENWLELNWVAVPYDTKRHAACFEEAGRALAARRASRQIPAIDEPGKKCTLTGAQSALPVNWDNLRERLNDPDEKVLRKNEQLGAIAMIKRFAGEQYAKCGLDVDRFLSTDDIAGKKGGDHVERGKETTSYLAVLHMDGDKMGKHLSQMKELKEHQQFSRELSKFADEAVGATLRRYPRAQLVYSGGDDVLALLPIENVLQAASELRDIFERMTGCKASTGIALTPADLPLDLALDLARQAEHDAKEHHKRDAVVVMEAHGTGQMRSAGGPWELDLVATVAAIQQEFSSKHLSGKLGYDLQQLTHDLVPAEGHKLHIGVTDMLRSARELELKRLIGRRVAEGIPKEEKKRIINEHGSRLFELGEHERCGWDSLANWVILARFLAQGEANRD